MKNTMIKKQVYEEKEVNVVDQNGEITKEKVKTPARTEFVDFNWEKVFLDNFLSVILALRGKKQTQITFYLIHEKDSYNKVNTTQSKIAKDCSASIQTVNKTIMVLKKSNFLKYRNGIYFINPDMLFYGTHSKREQMLISYNNF